jgi:hypothetical protein
LETHAISSTHNNARHKSHRVTPYRFISRHSTPFHFARLVPRRPRSIPFHSAHLLIPFALSLEPSPNICKFYQGKRFPHPASLPKPLPRSVPTIQAMPTPRNHSASQHHISHTPKQKRVEAVRRNKSN